MLNEKQKAKMLRKEIENLSSEDGVIMTGKSELEKQLIKHIVNMALITIDVFYKEELK